MKPACLVPSLPSCPEVERDCRQVYRFLFRFPASHVTLVLAGTLCFLYRREGVKIAPSASARNATLVPRGPTALPSVVMTARNITQHVLALQLTLLALS